MISVLLRRALVCAVIALAIPLKAQTTGILREFYSNISGGTVAALTSSPNFPSAPDSEFIESLFEAPSNFADNYGQRMRAFITPPLSGPYTFWISSDDNSALYLSTDTDPAHKTQIAYVSGWTNSREWSKEPNQQSAPITLTAGTQYYIEALQADGGGGDNLAVRWQLPNGTIEEPIPDTRMIPAGLTAPVITAQPTNVVVVEAQNATFSIKFASNLGLALQWQGQLGASGWTNIPNATNLSLTLSNVPIQISGSSYKCLALNAYGSTNSAAAMLTVSGDITPPRVQAVGNLGDTEIVSVVYSEPVEADSATNASNYVLDNGGLVVSARMAADPRVVILNVSGLVFGNSYMLTVNNVRDLATIQNTILTNSQIAFTLSATPLALGFLQPRETAGPSSRHGPIAMTEIMYAPAPRPDARNLQFVELYNSQPYFEDISGYRLAGDINFIFPTNTTLAGLGYLVLAANPDDLRTVTGATNVFGPFTSALPRSKGTVQLRNRLGAILLNVNYSAQPPWPVAASGAGHSLVLTRPSLGEGDPEAWSFSELMGGSPSHPETVVNNPYGAVVINEFLAHTEDAQLDYIELYNYSALPVSLAGCILTDDPETNRFVFDANATIAPLGFVVLDQNQLGFALRAEGETIYLINPSGNRVLDAVRFAAQEKGVSSGRVPDGGRSFRRLVATTPGASNSRARIDAIGINEIMYAPISGDDQDEYVELYNRGPASVDLSNWRISDGIDFTFPQASSIAAGDYIVVAKSVARMLTNYPSLDPVKVFGNFSGKLAGKGERIALSKPGVAITTNDFGQWITNKIDVVVDDVTYGVGGRWGNWSHGGGSSLELIDPAADKNFASNWRDSDESAKSDWVNIEKTAVLDLGMDTLTSLQIISLASGGEYLVDDVQVIPAGGVNRISNSSFETGITGWVPQGNHVRSTWEVGRGYNSTHSLHVRSSGHGDTGANRIRTTLTSSLSAGQTVTIRAKVKWLSGFPEILFRLHGNWSEATGNILTARNLGTPGARNSTAVSNAPPAIFDVRHTPPVPTASQSVTITARVSDPDGLMLLFLKYRIDPSATVTAVPMVNNGAGLFSATIPTRPAGTLVAFYIEASDNAPIPALATFPNNAPKRECLVRWGDPVQVGNLATYRVWMTQATFKTWSNREHLSNEPLDITFVYNGRVIYNAGGQYSGSPYHAPGFNTPTGNVCDYLLNVPEDDLFLGETDFTLQWPGNGGGDSSYQREQTAYWIASQLGLPSCYRRSVKMYVNGVRRAELMEDVQQPNGDMVSEYYPDADAIDLYKIQIWFEFDDPAVTFSGAGANLGIYNTTGGVKKLARYRWNWAKRAVNGSVNDYSDLFALVDTVNTTAAGDAYTRQLRNTLDVDNWLRTYAVEHIVGNNDSYAYGGGQNMYTCKPDNDAWKLMIWDIDFAFSAQPANSDLFSVGGGRTVGPDLVHPPFRRTYWQALLEAANGALGAASSTLLDAKYKAFVAAGAAVDNPQAIKDYISARRTYILGLLNTVSAPFAIKSNNGTAFSTNANSITLTGTAPMGVYSIRLNGVEYPLTWTTITNWSATILLNAGNNALTAVGYSKDGQPLTNASSSINITYTGNPDPAQGFVVLNEIMSKPTAVGGGFIELYNRSATTSYDLSGWRLDGPDFIFPSGTILRPGAYNVVAENGTAFTTAYGAIPFVGVFGGKLDVNGELLELLQPSEGTNPPAIVDRVKYSAFAPWPGNANTAGASFQLIDAAADNARVASWQVVTAPPTNEWQYVTYSGNASSTRLYIYLQSAGDIYLDDIKIVPGAEPEQGQNSVINGDFESPLAGSWNLSANVANSALSTTVKHSGNSGLHLVATSPGLSVTTAIWQDCSPALVTGQPYTLSYWYLSRGNGGPLTVRLSGSGITTTIDTAPVIVSSTPGRTNSVAASLPAAPPLWLNEIQPLNVTGSTDSFGVRHPWIELYNSGTTNIDLSNYFLANNYTNLLQWKFPPGTVISNNQFRIVWLDSDAAHATAADLHAGFSSTSLRGQIALVSTNTGRASLVDYLNYDAQVADRSYGAIPDGDPIERRALYIPTAAAPNNPTAAPFHVFINEWMADNGGDSDWFELYNANTNAVDLAGCYLSDTLTNKTQFKIPSGYQIAGRGFLLVWADNNASSNNAADPALHVSFQLSKSGEAIGLFSNDGAVIDAVTFGAQRTYVSEGRWPDSSESRYFMTNATPGFPNQLDQTNNAPVFAAIPSINAHAGQTVEFTVTGSDLDLPSQALRYTIEAAPAGAVIDPLTGLFTWSIPPDAISSTADLTLRVTDNGIPPLSATATFQIMITAGFQISNVNVTDSQVTLQFTTASGKHYRVEYTDELNPASWNAVENEFVGDGTAHQTTDRSPQRPDHRFYRVLQLD